MKRVFRYLKGTSHWGLNFQADDLDLHGYADASYADDIDSRKSTSGFLFMLGSTIVDWMSRAQRCVALSTAEAEYICLAEAAKETSFLRQLLSSIGIAVQSRITIYEDNQGAVYISGNPVDHNRTKHIDVRYHYVREKVADGAILVQYIPTEKQVADYFKALPEEKFKDFVKASGVF